MPLTENTKKLAKLVQTSKYTHDRMTLMGELDFRPDNDDRTYQRINIYEDLEYQSIEGFGGLLPKRRLSHFINWAVRGKRKL